MHQSFRLGSPVGALLAVAAVMPGQSWLPTSPFPTWAANAPSTTIQHAYNAALDAAANGLLLQAAIAGLQPGQALEVAPGTYSINPRFDISKTASAAQPIWVRAANPNQRPVITRPNANQNTINLGSNAPLRYLVLQNLEFTGGADLVRFYDCENVWLDGCYIHDGGGVGIAAQTRDTRFLYITRNEVARPGPGTLGEALYLGGNNGSAICSWSVVAYNHVHDTRSAVVGQGDGIEIKNGSHHNWVLGNHVHDTKNPCLLVYGTNGVGENVIESNLLYDSDDAVLQVQGDAIVRNNIAVSGVVAFNSFAHQGPCQNLTFVHNTLVNARRCFQANNWAGRPGMVLANNVVYSLDAEALYFTGGGSAGVAVAGNVVHGATVGVAQGFVRGSGVSDFASFSLDPLAFDLTPTVGGAIDNRGVSAFALPFDQTGRVRQLPVDPGAIANADTLAADVAGWPVGTGGQQTLTFQGAAAQAGMTYLVLGSISGTPGIPVNGFEVPLGLDSWFFATLNSPNTPVLQNTSGSLAANGSMTARISLPPLPGWLAGLVVHHAAMALGGDGSLRYASNAVPLTLQ